MQSVSVNDEYIQRKKFLKDFISTMYKEYEKYCNKWLEANSESINLKRKRISDIYDLESGLKEFFEKFLDEYREDLDDLYFDLLTFAEITFEDTEGIKFSIRKKSMESLHNKIHKKRLSENGSFPIKKCLNDLLGCRIIDSDYEYNIEILKDVINELKNDCEYVYKIKDMDRVNNGYKAYHIYFEINNNVFSMELQVWNKKDEDSNIKLHKEHKQDYINKYI